MEASQFNESHRHIRAVYVISVAAEIAGIHPQTLRLYERKGLLDPQRTGGGSRRYSEADISRLRRIMDLTNSGLNRGGNTGYCVFETKVHFGLLIGPTLWSGPP